MWLSRICGGLLRLCRAGVPSVCGRLSSAPGLQIRRGSWGTPALPCESLLFPCKSCVRPLGLDGLSQCFVHCNKFEPQIAPARQPVFERGHSVGAVAVQVAVITVVQAENVAGQPAAVAPAWRKFFASVLGNRIHALDQPFRRLHPPIARDQSPHYGLHSKALHNFAKPRAAKAKRRPEPARFNSRRLTNRLATPLQLLLGFSLAAQKKIRMRIGVIAEGMPPCQNLLRQLRALENKLSHKKKCRPCVVLRQQVEKSR